MRLTVKLSEVGEIVTGTTPSKKESKYWGGSIPFVKPPHLGTDKMVVETEETLTEEGARKGNIIPKNSIMVCCIGSLGKIGIAGRNLCTNQQINSIIFDDKKVDFKYGYYFCTTLEKIMNKMANQAIVQIINKSTFSNIEIPLPPLETQKAIVAKLDQIFAELDQTKSEIQNNLDNTDELWKSALNQAFQGDWEMKKLGDCVKINNGYVLTEFDENGKYACIKVGDMNLVENNPFITTSEHWINEYKENRIVEENSIIFPKRGAAIATNKKRLNKIPCYIDNNCMAISIKDNIRILPMFLFVFMQGFDLSTISNSAGIPLINNNDIGGVIIPVPPLSEQEKIVEHLDQVSKEVKALKSQYQSQLDNLEELKKSVLDKAFKGELG